MNLPDGSVIDLEFFETPQAFTRYLFAQLRDLQVNGLADGRLFEPCAGNGAIVRASDVARGNWRTNDLDPRWSRGNHFQLDATDRRSWLTFCDPFPPDWTITNPPFTPAVEILSHAIATSQVGVAAHLRVSIHEVLKTGPRRTWLHDHPPTAILYLPRFAYQRSKKTGIWTQDSAAACWVIWIRGAERQYLRYAPTAVLDELEHETGGYRETMDTLMGYTGSEQQRRLQRQVV